jgi:hypothetical protein
MQRIERAGEENGGMVSGGKETAVIRNAKTINLVLMQFPRAMRKIHYIGQQPIASDERLIKLVS